MGQYYKLVNVDKREFVNPHTLGSGLKLAEMIWPGAPGVGTAMIFLLAACPERRGGGDLEPDEVVGRWVGDRVLLIGDYAKDSDGPAMNGLERSELYGLCNSAEAQAERPDVEFFTDISLLVAASIEREMEGRYTGTGWRDWVQG